MFKYILYGTLFYLLFLFVTLPADISYAYWKKHWGDRDPIVLSGIEGSVWSGSVAQAMIKGQRVQQMQWHLKPFSLLLGKVEADVEFTVPDGFGKGRVGYSFFSGAYANDVEAWIPLPVVARFVNLAALRPGGKLNINLQDFAYDKGIIKQANGTLAWLDAEVSFFQPVALGNFQLDLSNSDEGVVGNLKDKGGPLQAQAKLSLNHKGDYSVDGEVILRDKSRNDLQQALQAMGRPNAKGAIPLKQKGNLSQLGLK